MNAELFLPPSLPLCLFFFFVSAQPLKQQTVGRAGRQAGRQTGRLAGWLAGGGAATLSDPSGCRDLSVGPDDDVTSLGRTEMQIAKR